LCASLGMTGVTRLQHQSDEHQPCLIRICQKSGCYAVADRVGAFARIPSGAEAPLCPRSITPLAGLEAGAKTAVQVREDIVPAYRPPIRMKEAQ
jgi:hypothetical protein